MVLPKKNPAARQALHTAWHVLDLDQLSGMSSYDRERICVPKRCNCRRKDCRYRCFLDACQSGQYTVQICNHNLLLADLIHRSQKKKPLLPDSAAIIIDEAHKLPETARQMFGVTLTAQDFAELICSLHVERYVLAAELLWSRWRRNCRSRWRKGPDLTPTRCSWSGRIRS